MPMTKRRRRSAHQHTSKADRMAAHIVAGAKESGRYRGREKRVAWATVHKDLTKGEAHRRQRSSGKG